MNEFEKKIASNIKATIGKIKRQGTVGMSVANLKQITPTPPIGLEGAPSGPQGYNQVFANVVATIKVKGFRIYD